MCIHDISSPLPSLIFMFFWFSCFRGGRSVDRGLLRVQKGHPTRVGGPQQQIGVRAYVQVRLLLSRHTPLIWHTRLRADSGLTQSWLRADSEQPLGGLESSSGGNNVVALAGTADHNIVISWYWWISCTHYFRKLFHPEQLDVFWENLVLALIGETIDEGDEICGCRVVDRSARKGSS